MADVDSFDVEIDQPDPTLLADMIVRMEPTFGAILLEDVCVPDCFHVETECQVRAVRM